MDESEKVLGITRENNESDDGNTIGDTEAEVRKCRAYLAYLVKKSMYHSTGEDLKRRILIRKTCREFS